MCIFSQPVYEVSNTAIFAGGLAHGRQVLAYQMQFAAAVDTAMVLPLPVTVNGREDSVEFINLEGYPSFFEDLARGFPLVTRSPMAQPADTPTSKALKVHDVGEFEASYVPTHRDWHRLDERFRLPNVVWDAIPQYQDYGFAVFKLKATKKRWYQRDRSSEVRKVHPMAFSFPRREPGRLFYPTVHVHEGAFEENARFDHLLYAQSAQLGEGTVEKGWRRSEGPASTFMSIQRSMGMIDPDLYCYQHRIRGMAPNADVWIAG